MDTMVSCRQRHCVSVKHLVTSFKTAKIMIRLEKTLLERDPVWSARNLLMSWWNVLPSHSYSLKMAVECLSETSVNFCQTIE